MILSRRLGRAVVVCLGVTSSLMFVSAFFGIRVASEVGAGGALSADITEATSNEVAFGGWSSFALLSFVITAILVMRWTWVASRALDARGAAGRRWRGGWTVGAWFIPIANLVIPKLMFNELERGLQVPASQFPIAEAWRSRTRTQVADVWWATWVAATVVGQIASVTGGAEGAPDDAVAMGMRLVAMSMFGLAVAGVSLAIVIRRMEAFATR
jgi:Domain of unknown function (DUF4328)